MKHLYAIVFSFAMAFSAGVQAQSVPDTVGSANNYYCNFEDSAECSAWTFVNGALTNQWYIGTAANYTENGSRSLYISNDNGVSNSYITSNSATVFAYRDISLTEGAYVLEFDWRCYGESSYDYLIAALVPQSVTLEASSGLPDGMSYDGITMPNDWLVAIGFDGSNILRYQSNWTHHSAPVEITTAGTYHLVFLWRNDASAGSQPPAAVDNINFYKPSCPWVQGLSIETTDSSARVYWNQGEGVTEWIVNFWGDMAVTDTTVTINNLDPNSFYSVNVRSVCSNGDTIVGVHKDFRTDCSNTLPFIINEGTGNSYNDFIYCITKGGTYGSPEWSWNSFLQRSMPHFTAYYSQNNNTSRYSYIALPEFDTDIDSLYLNCSFICENNGITATAKAIVGVMSDPDDFNTFVGIDTIDMHEKDANSITLYTRDFAGYGIYGNHIAIVAPAPMLYGDTYAYNYFYVDGLIVGKTSGCSYIDKMKITPGDTAVAIDWHENGTATNWLMRLWGWYSDTTFSVSDTHVVLSNLEYSQDYWVSIQALCQNGDTGATIGGHFITLCPPVAHTEMPYFTSFEDKWLDENGNINQCWRSRNSIGLQYPNPIGSQAFSNQSSLHFKATSNTYSYAVLPLFEDSTNNLTLYFRAKKDNYNYNQTLIIGVMDDPEDITTFDTITLFNNIQNYYQTFETTFDQYTGNGRHIAMLAGYTNSSSESYVYVDDVMVSVSDSCSGLINNITSSTSNDTLVISWDVFGTATEWEIKYAPYSFESYDDNVSQDTAYQNSLTINNYTNYNRIVLYLRPLCANESMSWQGPFDINPGIAGVTAVPVNGNATIRGCNLTVYDNGLTGQYSNYSSGRLLVYPTDTTMYFSISGTYNTESCCDHIYIYNGTTTGSPLLAKLDGNGDVNSLLSDGPVLIVFTSDGSVIDDGFELNFSCLNKPTCARVNEINIHEVSVSAARLSWTLNFSDLPMPESFKVRWSNEYGETDSLYTTDTVCEIGNLSSGTTYNVMVSSICGGQTDYNASSEFYTKIYGCELYDSTLSFFDTIWDPYSTSTTNHLPSNSYYNYSFTEQLFYSSELSAGTITNISLMPSYVCDQRKYEIYMAHTKDSILTGIVFPTEMTLVYSSDEETELVANEWYDFELTTPFTYNDTDNLIVIFRDITGQYLCSNSWYCHSTNHNSVYLYRDSEPYIPGTFSGGTLTNIRNNIIFSNKTCIETAGCAPPMARVTDIGAHNVSLSWLSDSCADFWKVEYRTEQSDWMTATDSTTQNNYTLDSLLENTQYEIRITSNADIRYAKIIEAKTICDLWTVPFFEDFTISPVYDRVPECWFKSKPKNNQQYPAVTNDYYLNGWSSLRFYNSDQRYAALPKFDTDMDSLNLYFSMYLSNYDFYSNNILYVGVMSNPEDITTFNVIDSAHITVADEWQYFHFNMAGAGDGNIALVSPSNRNSRQCIDLIEVLPTTSCTRPQWVRVTNTTATTATIEWESTGAESYLVEYQVDNWTDENLTGIITNNNRITITGLTGSTTYNVYVTAICSANDSSYRTQKRLFTTACSINEVPFTEAFEGYGNGTSHHTPTCWYYGSYTDTYPFLSLSYNHTDYGNTSMYMYCYDNEHEGHITYFTMPELELDTLVASDLQAAFYGYAQGTSSQHRVIVGVCDTANMMSTFTPVDTVIIEPNKWDIYEVTFDSYTGNGKYITFVSSVAPGNKYSYPYLDDLTIEPIPPCQRPNNLYANEESATANTIEIGWNDRSSATQWIVEYGDKGFTPGTGTQVVANSNPFTLTGIHRGYEGEFYVKAVCSSESSSDWSRRPCQFKTVCDTMSDVIVACDSYTWHGTTYNSSITGPLYDAPDIPSCDSLVVLHLTVKHSTEGTETLSACDSYTWYGNTYTASTTAPTHHLTNAVGCDSTAHLSLTIRYSTEGTEVQTACDSYTWYGNTYTTSTTAPTHLLTNAVGCDSTAHLNLTMKYSTTATEQVVTCDRSSYTWRGQTFTESTNSATYTLPNTVGCDSVITLHLNMSHSDTGIETVDVCDSYTWHGNTYTVSTNTATYETNTVTGCDSTVTLHLTVRYSNAANFSDIACDSYTWHGNTYTASTTTPTYTSTNIAGCDSTTTLLLTILNSTSSNEIVSACDSYQWHGNTYTTSTSSPTFITTNAVGCDSVIHLNLTVRYSSEGTLTLTACDSYTWHGTTYTESTNTPTWLTLNNAGCDSLVTLNLTVNYSNTGIDNQTACDSYTWHGTTYTASTNTPTYMSTNNMGCDSTTTLHLTVNYSNSGIETVSECDSYLWHGTVYTASTNTPTFMSTNAAGCDSTTTLHLTMNHSSSSIDNVTACDSYRWHGVDYTTSTSTPTFATSNAVGCDSTVVLHLTVNYSNTGIDNQTACDSYTWHGVVYTTSVDTATFVETNAAGCDSTVTLHLTVNYSTTGSESATACDSYTWHGSTYTTSGTPTYQETNAAGCDSTITLTLTINQSTSSSESATACDSYTWHGSTYTTSGTPTHQETNAAGCDSTITLTLTINYSSTGSESATACDSLLWHGNTYTTSGNPTYLTTNAAGCDSTVTLNLTINYSSTGSESATACDSYTWNNATYAESGEYSYQTTNAAGCDSTVTLTLTINTSSQTEITDTATGSYQWNGETYTESGTYTWTGTNAAGCDSTVTLHLFIQEVGINTIDGTNAINVYPNPTSGLLNIDAEGLTAIEVYDINGRVVATYGAENKINIASLPAGAYTLRIQTQQGNHIRRIILK